MAKPNRLSDTGPKPVITAQKRKRRQNQRLALTPSGFPWWLELAYDLWANHTWTTEEIGIYMKKPPSTVANYLWHYKKHLVETGAIKTTKRPASRPKNGSGAHLRAVA